MRNYKFVMIVGLALGMYTCALAVDLESMKVFFLNGDYKQAITEGEKIIARHKDSSQTGELYYLLGLSYLKDGNYLRASDIFEIILRELEGSQFKERAKLGLGDTYFLRDEYALAEEYYQEIIKENPLSEFKPSVLYRLSQTGFKKGDIQQGKAYLDRLNTECPVSAELLSKQESCSIPQPAADLFYSVQVGSFSRQENAVNLRDRLIKNNYDAYVEEFSIKDAPAYRVKVGRMTSRSEIIRLQERLAQDGFPTKVCP